MDHHLVCLRRGLLRKVELKDQLIRVVGNLAYEVGVEHAEFKLAGQKVAGQIRVTNVYQRETNDQIPDGIRLHLKDASKL